MSNTLLTPALARCRRLFLRNHVVDINIGAHAFEQGHPQRVRINVDLYVPLACSTPVDDDLGEVVDYDFVREAVRERVGRGHIQLQETLADDLLRALLAHPRYWQHASRPRNPMSTPTAKRSASRCLHSRTA